jgi:drug/metabolite transporter (DMT)-like permease
VSDINLNLDGVMAFIAAAALGILLVLGILIGSLDTFIRARRRHEPFNQQRLFPQAIGMLVSLFCCLIVVLLLLFTQRMPPPRALDIWFDNWLWLWLAAVLALWPVSAFAWKKWRGRLPVSHPGER